MKRPANLKLPLPSVLVALALSLLVGLAPSPGNAIPYTMTDGNSSAVVDPSLPAGMYNWPVDGKNYFYQQWFWYRVGSTTTASPINTLNLTLVTQPDPGHLDFIYSDPLNRFTIAIDYTLKDGLPGSGVADMGETIKINHLQSISLDFHFFQYSDFDLGGIDSFDRGFFAARNDVYQYYPDALNILALHETTLTTSSTPPVIGSYPSHWEMNTYPNTLNNLNYAIGYVLKDNPALGVETGPADLTWAFEWDRNFGSCGSLTISKNKGLSVVVPIPRSALLLGTGLLG